MYLNCSCSAYPCSGHILGGCHVPDWLVLLIIRISNSVFFSVVLLYILGPLSRTAQELLFALCSVITPGSTLGPYRIPRIEPELAECKTSVLPMVYLSRPSVNTFPLFFFLSAYTQMFTALSSLFYSLIPRNLTYFVLLL